MSSTIDKGSTRKDGIANRAGPGPFDRIPVIDGSLRHRNRKLRERVRSICLKIVASKIGDWSDRYCASKWRHERSNTMYQQRVIANRIGIDSKSGQLIQNFQNLTSHHRTREV